MSGYGAEGHISSGGETHGAPLEVPPPEEPDDRQLYVAGEDGLAETAIAREAAAVISGDGQPAGRLAVSRQVDVSQLRDALGSSRPETDMEEFVTKLHSVGQALSRAGLPDAFNFVYYYLSKETLYVARQLHPDDVVHPTFRMPEKIEKTAGIFGELYLKQLRHYCDYVDGDDEALDRIIPPWQLALLHPKAQGREAESLQFLAGMKTHIVRDLPEALQISGIDPEYFHDYARVMSWLFHKVRRELAPMLVPGPMTRKMKIVAAMPVIAHIANIRRTAWSDSIALDAAAAGPPAPDGGRPAAYDDILRRLDMEAVRQIRNVLSLGRGAILMSGMFGGSHLSGDRHGYEGVA